MSYLILIFGPSFEYSRFPEKENHLAGDDQNRLSFINPRNLVTCFAAFESSTYSVAVYDCIKALANC